MSKAQRISMEGEYLCSFDSNIISMDYDEHLESLIVRCEDRKVYQIDEWGNKTEILLH